MQHSKGGAEIMKHSAITEDQQKQEGQKRRHFSIRINMFFFFTFLLFSILIVQLARLQFVEGKAYSADEKHSRNADVVISPIRGNIYDRNGAPIAYTISGESLFYRLQDTAKKKQPVIDQERIDLAKQLQQIFAKYGAKDAAPLSADEIIAAMDVGIDINGKHIKDSSQIGITYMPRRIKSKLSNQEVAYILEHRDELQGLEISEESTRVYDSDNTAVQLVGYMRAFDTASRNLSFYKKSAPDEYLNDEYVGYDGLELLYQDELRGKKGVKNYPINARDQIVGQVKITPPVKGHNLVLTIDKGVQLAAQKAMADQLTLLKNSPSSPFDLVSKGNQAVAGYAVAMEVDTGRVMAMVNMPDYNPNLWLGSMSQQVLDTIQYSYTNGTIRERYGNFPSDKNEYKKHPTSLVPPGSTLKPLSVLMGLNEGLIAPGTHYNDQGVFHFGKDNNSTVTNSDRTPYGYITPAQALEHSSNTFMSEMIGNNLYLNKKNPIDIFDYYMKSFGLGKTTGSGLPFESEGDIGYINNKTLTNQAALVFGSFGQSARYTTLQLAQYASMLANHGKRYKPLFVDSIKTYDGQLIQKIEPQLLSEVKFPDSYWKVLDDGMSKVGISGFDGTWYKVNRKTGTSESQFAGQKVDNAVFIAYAPADKPKLAVAVVVPEGGFGRYGAGPVARQIFDAYDKYYGLDGVPKGK
jgi:cell division protein FtsI/penicillin-binding protein 2